MLDADARNARWVRQAVERELSEAHCAGSGGRNETLLRVACRVLELSNTLPRELPRDAALARLLEAADAAGLPASEARAVLRSAERRTDGRNVRHQLPCPYGDPVPFQPPRRRLQPVPHTAKRRAMPVRKRRRPPAAELASVWASGEQVPAEVLACLSGKSRPGIVAARAIELDLMRLLPRGAELPEWAGHWSRGHRVIVKAFDASGRWVTLRARTPGAPPDGVPKEFPPRGFEVGGTVLACGLAQRLLAREPNALEVVRRNGIVLTEGTPSWLAWASRHGADDDAPAVVGYCSGAWTHAHAAAVPGGTRAVIDPDRNDAGRRMMARIAETLCDRAQIEVTKERKDG